MRGLRVDTVKKSLWIFSDSAIFQYHVTRESRYLQVCNWLIYKKYLIVVKSTVAIIFLRKSPDCKLFFCRHRQCHHHCYCCHYHRHHCCCHCPQCHIKLAGHSF